MPPFFDQNGDPTLNPYTVLSLPPTASDTDIKKAYRTQMLQLHPDKLSPDLTETQIAEITEQFHNVKDAYEFLISPQYLTGRRLYMAKMASKRAEYERREAFLRRGGAVDAASGVSGMYTQHTRMSSYPMNQRGVPRGGGGGQQQQQQQHGHGAQHHNGGGAAGGDGDNNLHRSKSEPRFEPNARTQPQRQSSRRAERSTGMGQPRYYKSNTVRTTAGEKQRASQPLPKRRSGYTSDTKDKYKNTTRTTSRGREGNKSSKDERRNSSKNERGRNNDNATNHKSGSDKNRQHRARSEPRRSRRRSREDRNGSGSGGGSRGSNSDANNNNSNNDRVRFETAAEPTYKKSSSNNNKHRSSGKDSTTKRQRARSAPARCGDKKDRFSSSRYNNNSSSRDKSNSSSNPESSSHPQEFYCPLTKRLMKDPVIDNDGNTYEREAIERWLRVQSSSPITNGHLSVDQLRPNRELKSKIHKVAGKPRSKSQPRARSRSKTRCSSPNNLNSGRVLIDSYLREISNKSKLSVSLDGMGICAFSYRRTTFVIEVPITPGAGFMVYSSFDAHADQQHPINEKIEAWNKWLTKVMRCGSRVSYVKAGNKSVFTLKGSEKEMIKCDVFQKTLEYFVEMSLKLHNLLHPAEAKSIDNVCLTRAPVHVAVA